MKRLQTPVKALVKIGDEVHEVEVLDYDRDRYYTIRLPDNSITYVKHWSLYNLPFNFNKYKLPYDYEVGITNKEIAKDLRKHKRYHYKFLSKSNVELSIYFITNGFTTSTAKGTRKQLLGHIQYLHNQGKLQDFNLQISFYYKGSSTFSTALTYKDGKVVVTDFRNKKQNKYVKQLLRSMLHIT